MQCECWMGLQDGMCLLCHRRAAVWCNPSCEFVFRGSSEVFCGFREKGSLTGAHYVKPDIFISISDAPWGNFPHRLSCIYTILFWSCYARILFEAQLTPSILHQRQRSHTRRQASHHNVPLADKIEMLPFSKFRGRSCSLNYMVMQGGFLWRPTACFLVGVRYRPFKGFSEQ